MVAIAANPTPAEISNQANLLNTNFPGAWNVTVMIMSMYTTIMATLDFKTWQAVRRSFQFNFVDTGNAAAAQELAENDPQVVRLGTWASRLKAFGVIVNVAVGVMSIIAIVDTVNAANQMSEAISEAQNGMSQYLTALLNSENAQQNSANS